MVKYPAMEKIPAPSERRIALHLSPPAEHAVRAGHPWIFDQSIQHQSHAGQAGDLAVVFDQQRKFLGIGLYDPFSPIRVRLLQHHKPAPINCQWFQEKNIKAKRIRSSLPANTTGYRLIHGENDGLPGLVVDKYDHTLVIKLDTLAWIPHLADLVPILDEIESPERMIIRLARGVARRPEVLYGLEDGTVLYGDRHREPILFLENGITFEADPIHGQKTGFFLDQRDNRARVETLSRGKSVLNVFAYSGGFSVYAARGGALNVTSIDTSNPALEAARRNFDHNRSNRAVANCQHETITADAFEALQQLGKSGKQYDLVIIDPPSFAKNQREIQRAMTAYQRLMRLGLEVLHPGGILVQASCSSRIRAEDFFTALHQAANEVKRPLTEIERTGHPLDHPIGFAEGAYLKCLFAKG
jgi:23S rRNA (cytosine1962-C5)-methyltransferase